MRLLSEAVLLRGNSRPDKPNEDYVLADSVLGVFIVCDGVTRTAAPRRYPVPSPSARAAELAAKQAMKCLSTQGRCLSPRDSLVSALLQANQKVGDFNAIQFPEVDYLESDLAGTVMAISVVCGSTLNFGYIGDCAIRVLRGGSALRLTTPQTDAINMYRREHGSPPASTVEIRKNFRNKLGNPFGYGCLTGEVEAREFFATGRFDLLDGDVILMSSDGVEPALESAGEELARLTAAEIVHVAELAELRSAVESDDKAVIRIALTAESSDLVPCDA